MAFYNLPRVERIRHMRSNRIGQLIALSGTVTRSSEVRPELLSGSFICRKCGTLHTDVEQQFQYTEPYICKNNACTARDFQLNLEKSLFVDWQRLRVQENADEIPAGSMPRCIDIVCRNEVVESAKAGDKILFTGTVVIIPDVAGSAGGGEAPMTGKSTGSRNNDTISEGIQGLKQLGVKEMTYKMIFLACSVQLINDKKNSTSTMESILDSGVVQDDVSNELTHTLSDSERQIILNMRNTSGLYHKMASSICPSVYGHLEVKRGILLMLLGGVHKTTPEGISLR